MTRVEGSASAIDDVILQQKENNSYLGQTWICEAIALPSCYLTDDAARLIVRLNKPGNGFKTWRQLYDRFACRVKPKK